MIGFIHNNKFKQEGGDKLLNLYVIPKYSMAAYKSYIKNGFNINTEKRENAFLALLTVTPAFLDQPYSIYANLRPRQ